MLESADAQLVRRDPALPGLAIVLDPEDVGAALEANVPELELRKISPAYVRYKPDTSCLVAYLTHSVLGTQFAYAKAHRSGTSAKVEKMLLLPGKVTAETPAPLHLGDDTVLAFFPFDRGLRAARRLGTAEGRADLLRQVLPEDFVRDASLVPLRYKPERRWVARVDGPEGPRALLKCYTGGAFAMADAGAAACSSDERLRLVRRLGTSAKAQAIAFEWLPGRGLSDLIARGGTQRGMLRRTGAALAALHAQPGKGLPDRTPADEGSALDEAVSTIATLRPEAADLANAIASRAANSLGVPPGEMVPIHGDFSADQVLVSGNRIALIDLDAMRLGDPATDLALFVANLERATLNDRLGCAPAVGLAAEFLDGYESAGGRDVSGRLGAATAARLLRLAPEPFRYRQPGWPARLDALLRRAWELLG